MRHAYLGPSFDDTAIEPVLDTCKIHATRLSDPAATAAEMLSKGKILGWYQGRMEFGPRALGSRSILADPRDPKMNIKVNNAVKFREWWRPFAPSIKKEVAPEYLESAYDSPFMILTAQIRPEKRNVIPSVTHVDGSARPQTVEEEINPLYYRVIDEFGKHTGVPVLMNTPSICAAKRSCTLPPTRFALFIVRAWMLWSSAVFWWKNDMRRSCLSLNAVTLDEEFA